MSIESFDPKAVGAQPQQLDAAALQRLVQAAADTPPSFGLSQLERERFATVSAHSAATWAAAVSSLEVDVICNLIRFFTLAEASISGWQAGSKSPVIALVRALKTRDAYPAELTTWIKANTTNRFLPHGSLMDRL